METPRRLQPLRIAAGWTVEYAQLREIDPRDAAAHADGFFRQDLLQLKHYHHNRLLDVGWYPEGDMNGAFGLVVYEGDFHGKLLLKYQTNLLHELVAEIERLVYEVSEGRF